MAMKRQRKVLEAGQGQYEYVNPPIPEGYKHIDGEWFNGYVIEKIQDGSQFVWIPVGSLKPNGTIGKKSDSKFGRRNFKGNNFLDYHEELDSTLKEQVQSVEKYGGFYFSRYGISKNLQNEPQSKQNQEPWTYINYIQAKEVAEGFEKGSKVTSHLIYGSEYDSVLEWIIESFDKPKYDVVTDSSSWGNYRGLGSSHNTPDKTGSNEAWKANEIFDLAGNEWEITQERSRWSYMVIRGGSFYTTGRYSPASDRKGTLGVDGKGTHIGFRIALCIL
jgi:hypothetical protein